MEPVEQGRGIFIWLRPLLLEWPTMFQGQGNLGRI